MLGTLFVGIDHMLPSTAITVKSVFQLSVVSNFIVNILNHNKSVLIVVKQVDFVGHKLFFVTSYAKSRKRILNNMQDKSINFRCSMDLNCVIL